MKNFKLICIFLFLSFNLDAFEVKGFKGGMSFDEVVAKANSKSWYFKPYGDIENTYDIKNQKDITELSVSFCEINQKYMNVLAFIVVGNNIPNGTSTNNFAFGNK